MSHVPAQGSFHPLRCYMHILQTPGTKAQAWEMLILPDPYTQSTKSSKETHIPDHPFFQLGINTPITG